MPLGYEARRELDVLNVGNKRQFQEVQQSQRHLLLSRGIGEVDGVEYRTTRTGIIERIPCASYTDAALKVATVSWTRSSIRPAIGSCAMRCNPARRMGRANLHVVSVRGGGLVCANVLTRRRCLAWRPELDVAMCGASYVPPGNDMLCRNANALVRDRLGRCALRRPSALCNDLLLGRPLCHVQASSCLPHRCDGRTYGGAGTSAGTLSCWSTAMPRPAASGYQLSGYSEGTVLYRGSCGPEACRS